MTETSVTDALQGALVEYDNAMRDDGLSVGDRAIKIVSFHAGWNASRAVQQPNPTERPDDSEADAAIADAEDLTEALWEIAEKYQVPVTNNYERWQDGQWLREIGEFIGDIRNAVKRFPTP